MSKGKIGAIVLALGIIIGAILLVMCMERVPTGHVGVVYNMNGGVDGEVLTQGWHIVSPTKKVTTYSIGIEQSYLTAANKGDSKNDESFLRPHLTVNLLRSILNFRISLTMEGSPIRLQDLKDSPVKTLRILLLNPK